MSTLNLNTPKVLVCGTYNAIVARVGKFLSNHNFDVYLNEQIDTTKCDAVVYVHSPNKKPDDSIIEMVKAAILRQAKLFVLGCDGSPLPDFLPRSAQIVDQIPSLIGLLENCSDYEDIECCHASCRNIEYSPAPYCAESPNADTPNADTYYPQCEQPKFAEHLLFCALPNRNSVSNDVYTSAFAPAEVSTRQHMMVQFFLHSGNDTIKVIKLAGEADRSAKRRGYTPLRLPLEYGTNVDIDFRIYGEDCLFSERKSAIWRGKIERCAFRFFVPESLDVDRLYCEATISANGAAVAEISFTTDIVERPKQLYSNILSRIFKKVFISYSRKDSDKVQFLAHAYKALGIEYFFDRHSLSGGDFYKRKIQEFILSADLFILCWSQNAATSSSVAQEKSLALSRAAADRNALKIYPISIRPYAPLPSDMKDTYNFEIIE